MNDNKKEVAIEVRNLTKKYQLKPTATSHNNSDDEFYALNDVSFTIYKGDVIGIIGSNGSGKSTLLKILSQITKPSSGEVRFYGEYSSILDIGTNFNPDLTGRENVTMHLHLSGKPKKDFKDFQKNVQAFSEIGDFFDQPVKVYSSGMFLRLAFAVAFHLSSNILLLDEVLSVGDEGFRLKCQEMLESLAGKGHTILFVSHNRAEIIELSSQCLWLNEGKVKRFDKTASVLSEYFSNQRDNFDRKKLIIETEHSHAAQHINQDGRVNITWEEDDAPGNEVLTIHKLIITSGDGYNLLYNTEPVEIKFLLNKKKKGIQIGPFFFLQDIFYQPVLVGHFLNNTLNRDINGELKDQTGLFEIKCTIPPNFLTPGKYYFFPRFGIEENQWSIKSEEGFRFSEKLSFTIHPKPDYIDYIGDVSKGSVRPALNWEMNKV